MAGGGSPTMTIFAEFGLLILAMASLGEQFIGVGTPEYSGEYLGASLTNMLGDSSGAAAAGFLFKSRFSAAPVYLAADQAEIELMRTQYVDAVVAADGERTEATQAALNRWRTAAGRNPAAERARDVALDAASVILKALIVVELLQQLAGFGPPYEGDDLKSGSDQFIVTGEHLSSAGADNSWRGLASLDYIGINASLGDDARKMAELDRQLAELVKTQAGLVTHVRLGFGILTLLLAAAYVYEVKMALLPGAQAAAETYATLAAVVGISAAVSMILSLCGLSAYNASLAAKLTSQYNQLAADAADSVTETDMPAAVAGPPAVASGPPLTPLAPMTPLTLESARPGPRLGQPLEPVAHFSSGIASGMNPANRVATATAASVDAVSRGDGTGQVRQREEGREECEERDEDSPAAAEPTEAAAEPTAAVPIPAPGGQTSADRPEPFQA